MCSVGDVEVNSLGCRKRVVSLALRVKRVLLLSVKLL